MNASKCIQLAEPNAAYSIGASCGQATFNMFEELGNYEDTAVRWFRGFSESMGGNVSPEEEALIRGKIREAITRRAKIHALATGISMAAGRELLHLRELLTDLDTSTHQTKKRTRAK